MHIELRVDVLRVASHGVFRQVQRFCDVGLRAALAQHLHDLELSRRQAAFGTDGVAALVDAAVILRRAHAFAGQLGENPLRILVAHFQEKRTYHGQREHQQRGERHAVVPDGWLSYTDSKLLEEAAGLPDAQ